MNTSQDTSAAPRPLRLVTHVLPGVIESPTETMNHCHPKASGAILEGI